MCLLLRHLANPLKITCLKSCIKNPLHCVLLAPEEHRVDNVLYLLPLVNTGGANTLKKLEKLT